MKKAFVTFSNSAYRREPRLYKQFIAAIDAVRGVTISSRWFDAPTAAEKPASEKIIHQDSLAAITGCDVFIAETSNSSTSLGLQIGATLQKKKLTLLCMKEELRSKPVFNFLKGARSPFLHIIYYRSLTDLTNQVQHLIQTSHGTEKFEKFNFVTSNKMKKMLLSESARRNLSASELLRSIVEEWASQHNIK
jgi:hypothetical protein